MHDSPGSVVTQLCSGLQLYSAERRIADCILADVKWASVATSAELAKASHSSEATVTRLCHKLGYANYRKFQLELARDVLEQQETEARKRPPNDPLHQALLDLQNNRQEEVQATIQALNLVQLRKVLSILRAAEIIEIEANGSSLPVAMDASLKLGSLGKRCMISPVPEKARSFASALTPKDALLLISSAGRCEALETAARAAKKNGAHRSSSSPATSARRWQATPAIPCWPPTVSSALPAICCLPSFRQRWWWRRSTTCWWAISI